MNKFYRFFLYIFIIIASRNLLAHDFVIINYPNFNGITYHIAVQDSSGVNNNLLKQNYPNPFNPTTMISFNLPRRSYVELNIYNVLGVKLVTLIKGVKSAGSYSVQFNASDYPSGLYIYELQTDNYKQTKKMIYMK
jgi:hypothetical protein